MKQNSNVELVNSRWIILNTKYCKLIRNFELMNSKYSYIGFVWCMVIKAILKNTSATSWRSVLLLEETGVPGKSHRSIASHWQTLSHIEYTMGFELTKLVVIGTGCWKSNSHTITTTMTPKYKLNILNR